MCKELNYMTSSPSIRNAKSINTWIMHQQQADAKARRESQQAA